MWRTGTSGTAFGESIYGDNKESFHNLFIHTVGCVDEEDFQKK